MKNLKKLLYLLQLEEYQTDLYFGWLQKHPLQELQERKNKLRWSLRAILTLIISLPLIPLLGNQKAIGFGNNLLIPIFRFFEEVFVFLAKTKLKFHPNLIKIIITGSYGKTTFKEMLAWVLQAKYSILKTPGNVNTRLGIAKVILQRLKKHHQILIAEAGAYKMGEIRAICQLVQPSFGIITIIGWMHLERFKTLTNIQKTKLELVPFIKDETKLFLPSKNHQFIDFETTVAKIAKQLGISSKTVKLQLKTFSPPEHRLVEKKINNNLIILDNSYNSNPLGFQRSLKRLSRYQNFQKIVVTPGMIELGNKQFILNKQLAEKAAKIADIFVIVGQTNRKALTQGVQSAKKNRSKIIYLKKEENLDRKLSSILRPPTVILLENELPDHYF